MRVCGVPEAVLAASGGRACKHDSNPVYWTLLSPIPGIPVEEQLACARRAMASISAVCGLQLEYAPSVQPWERRQRSDGLIILDAHWIDGAGGTLAWSELPCGPRKQMQQRYDTSERWYTGEGAPPRREQISLQAVICHEVCHALGLSHGGYDLMAPTYDPAWIKPGPWTIQELVARYGEPRPRPVPVPTGGNMSKIGALSGLLTKLAPLLDVLVRLATSPQFQAILDLLVRVLSGLDPANVDPGRARVEIEAGLAEMDAQPVAALCVENWRADSFLSLLSALGRVIDALARLKDSPQFAELVEAIRQVIATLVRERL